MKKYEKYKESGIKWLGAVPEHWQIKRIKNFLIDTNKVSVTGTEDLLTVSHITGVTLRSEKNVNMFLAETNVGYKKCCPGDIIINTMWAWMGALGACKDAGICSPAYNVYRPIPRIEYHAQFFDYLFKTPNFIIEMTRYSKGIVSSRLRLYPREFYQIQSVIPPLSEQIAIANYLDSKTQLIDRKIELLNNKISYYKELRRSLINKIVCRGLDDNVKLKESKIDWIGKIPGHWEVKRLKSIGNIETSSVDKKIKAGESLVKLINYTDVYNNKRKEIWNCNEYMIVSANEKQIQSKRLIKGDVLFTPSSETIEDIGISSVVMEDLHNTLYSYHLLRFRLKQKGVVLGYRKYLFNNDLVQYYFSNNSIGTTRKILGLNVFNNLLLLLPPSNEQIKITKYLDAKTQNIDCIIKNLQQQIEKLQELRKTLINDVVTGKIKVTE